MDSDDDKDNKDTVLDIIPSNQLRLIPLYEIIAHIYEKIIEKAAECEFTYAFNIDQLIKNHELNPKIATPSNKTYIINEIKRLFPGIKITEFGEKYSARSRYNSYWSASWKEELDDVKDIEELYMGYLKKNNGEDDDIMLNQAIQLSLTEVKKPERVNNSTSIMGQKAEERIQKSRQKYKKLYN
jgi:hypothetical protein